MIVNRRSLGSLLGCLGLVILATVVLALVVANILWALTDEDLQPSKTGNSCDIRNCHR